MSTRKTEPGPGARPPAAPGRPRRRLDWLAGRPAALVGGLALVVGWAAPFLHRAVTDRPERRITLAPVYRAVNPEYQRHMHNSHSTMKYQRHTRNSHSTIRGVSPRRRCLPQVEGFERRALLSGVGPVGVASSTPVALSTATSAAYTVSVKDFGATGNGITDDAPAIQAALNSVPATGGTVLVPTGDYRLGESLVISHSGTALTGVGPASILRLMDGVTTDGIALPERSNPTIDPSFFVNNVTISRLTLDGNHNPIVTSGQMNYFGVYAGQTSYLTLSQLVVQNWSADGIETCNGNAPNDHLTVENCWITGCGRNGIDVGFATNTTIKGNHITDTPSQYWGPAAGNAIDVEVEGYNETVSPPSFPYVQGLLIQDNVIELVGTTTACYGIALQPAYGPIDSVTIQGNLIRNFQNAVFMDGTAGYYVTVNSVNNIDISNNWVIEDNMAVFGYMIALEGGANVHITNNTLHGGMMNDEAGIYFLNASNCTASKNTIIYSNYGVLVSGTSDTIALSDNKYGSPNIWYSQWLSVESQVTNFTESGDTQLSQDIVGIRDGGLVGSSQIRPTVSFGIANGTVISSPTKITVNASDLGSGVARVYFFVDGVPQGFSDKAPYVFVFDPSKYTPGTHTLGTLAVDQYGNLSAESDVSIRVR